MKEFPTILVAPTMAEARRTAKLLGLPGDTVLVGQDIRIVRGLRATEERTLFVNPDRCYWLVMCHLRDSFTREKGLKNEKARRACEEA